jgi:hypothetical protein
MHARIYTLVGGGMPRGLPDEFKAQFKKFPAILQGLADNTPWEVGER